MIQCAAMTKSPRKLFFAACVPVLALSMLGCQLPPPGTVGTTVRRAQPTGQGHLFYGAAALNVPFRSNSINNVARMLAGMEAQGGVGGSSAWPAHQQAMDRLWYSHENGRGAAVRHWAANEISDLQRSGSLFYPFSGPDFLFAQELFPQAETYVLCGLEPAEPLPNLASLRPDEVARGLSGLRESLTNIMQAGYFITKDMRSDFQATRFRGVLPVLLTFLARTGNSVDSVDIVRVDGMGNAVQVAATNGSAPGLMIRFHSRFGQSKRLFYFRQDLSNASLHPGGPFLTFVSKQGYPPALVKSASYLMHEGSFSNIRNYMLRFSRGIVQDPSGIPYRDLVRAGLSLNLYGNYQRTLSIFGQQQPDLVSAYRSGMHPVQPVGFGFGYLYHPATTSIIVARKR